MRMVFTLKLLKKGAVQMIFAFVGATVVVYGVVAKYVLSNTTAHLK